MLDADYYLDNFVSLVNFVGKTYNELLDESELAWLATFRRSSDPAQRLYVRLLGRRANTFRIAKLDYPEIHSVADAADELATRGLASIEPPQTLPDILPLFTKPELLKLANMSSCRKLQRAALLEFIIRRDSKADLEALQQTDTWITTAGLAEFAVFKLCFFGNAHQDTTEFVLRDLGLIEYEPYVIDQQSRAFHHRQQIDAHLVYSECAMLFEYMDKQDADALLELHRQLPSYDKADAHLARRVERLRNTIARQLERLERLEDALALYSLTTRTPSRERTLRILIKLQRNQQAYELWQAIAQSPIDELEAQFAVTIYPKLATAMGHAVKKQQRFKPVLSKLTLTRGDGRVEIIAREFYAQYGDCFYVENALINSVLGLFIWDIMYLPVPSAFYNPFQSAPADFYQPEFLAKRHTQLQQRFDELKDPLRFSARVWKHYETRHGIANRLVYWQSLTEELLSLALIRIPVKHWRALFDRILLDLANHTSGLPDLILFPRTGGYELLEVKGPGDTVQANQRQWMACFARHHIPYRVVHVRWAPDTSA